MIKPIIAMDVATTGKGGGPYYSTIRIMNSELKNKYKFKPIFYNTSLGQRLSIRIINDLVNQLKLIKPDIVHFTGLQLSGFHIAVACKIVGISKTVMVIRGTTSEMIFYNKFKKLIMKFIIEPITIILVNKIYGNSDYVNSLKLLKLFKHKRLNHIYNFPPKPYSLGKNKSIREELLISNDDIIITSIGRINIEKGYHVFQRAVDHFIKYDNLKFIIVGEGPFLEEMKKKLYKQVKNKQIYFLGLRSDVQRILNGCDVFVLPTLHETLSSVLLESSVEGLALIGSDVGGVPEIIENKYNGLLVKPAKVKELTKAIEIMIKNPKLIKQYGKNAFTKINNKFSNKIIIRQIDEVYKKLLGN